MEIPIPLCGSPLDREARRRREPRWLEGCLGDPASRFLPIWRGKLLLGREPEDGLVWAKREFFDDLQTPEPVLLGTDAGVAHFAVDVSAAEQPDESFGIADVARFDDLRSVVLQLPARDAAVAAQARSLIDWHGRHPHCAVCGEGTRPVQGGAHRVCAECRAEHFPRTDPVAISLVVRGDRCLLGRGVGWPEEFFSALAGFVEPGESLEEAVRREVQEETGVAVGRVVYLFSQPWPYPSSLMLGCIGEGVGDEAVDLDPVELEDARWFTREELRAAREGRLPGLALPPPMAIASHLIREWVERDAGPGSPGP